jgi:murein DD-endopeptidase MepM/ murein hydrolase activator NlpD
MLLLMFVAALGEMPSEPARAADGPKMTQDQKEALATLYEAYPRRYIVNYPAAERYCPPIASAFQDAVKTDFIQDGKHMRVPANGGYGVAMKERKGLPLMHTGADLGWFREGAPVFAVANGVVRRSVPGVRQVNAKLKLHRDLPAGPVDYGNLIIIEHRTVDNEYFLTLYAHLGDDRVVRAGDIVTAGQVIGTIGRDAGIVNGGYRPHCHFAVHDGRWLESGQKLMTLHANDTDAVVRVAELGEKESRVTITPAITNGQLTSESGDTVYFRRDGDQYLMPSFPLWTLAGPSRMPGYSTSLKGFRDPIQFLKKSGAETTPAAVLPFTTIHPRTLSPVVDEPAPELPVKEWLQPAENPPTLANLRGKVVCLVFFQATCASSLSHGLPSLRELADKYAHDDRVQVIGVQTPTSDLRLNAPLNARKLIHSAGLTCPVAHLEDARDLAEVAGFGVRATPWVVLIDGEGNIDFSNWILKPPAIAERIDELVGKVGAMN